MKHADKLIVQALYQSVEGLPTEEAIATLFKRASSPSSNPRDFWSALR